MKVQRCQACGARYNADRLEVGTVFDCNRCGAAVTVEGSSPVSLALLIAGFLVLGALFLWSPHARAPGLVMPWEESAHWSRDLAITVGTLLWMLLGIWAVVTALIPGASRRSVFTIAMGTVTLIAATTSTGGGFPIVSERSLLWMAAAITLGAGLVLAGRGERGVATTALLLGGGLSVILMYAAVFDTGQISRLELVWARAQHVFRGTEGATDDLLHDLGAHAALLFAGAGGILIGLGVRVRAVAILCGILLAVAMLLPGAVRFGEGFGAEFAWGAFAENAAQSMGLALVRDGVALWAVLTYAVADVVRARGGAS